jgi:hypothetical protein
MKSKRSVFKVKVLGKRGKRVKYPIQGKNCQHKETFDLKDYYFGEKKACLICNQ